MYSALQSKFAALQGAVVSYFMVATVEREKGQASAEYAGIIFVIVAIIAALVGLSFTDIGQAIIDKITEAIGQIGG